ncbi:MAG: DNA polymerase III subunit delta [Prevotellaceae bacterium]|jgi:DNA polymerase-3 subunit delta'|nr:DNA polymerase III subunit delta [Prevotellaceae bacterium]
MQFKDIVGQRELKEKLVSTVGDGRIGHAQLFEGAMGYGGLLMALAYARFISCKNRGEDSCGTCPSCVKYSKLIHPDLHFVFPVNTTKKIKDKPVSDDFLPKWREIVLEKKYFNEPDWYEFIGIENKQGIISVHEADRILMKLSYKPFESDYKIMIVWLPERLNPTSANRLLKLIEEPPKHTVFLLVTENSNRILPTIYSRTQRIRLHPLKEDDIVDSLKKMNFDEKETFTASRLSGGDYIQALQTLQVSESAKNNLDNFMQLMRLSYKNDVLGLLEWAESMASAGREKQKSFIVFAERLVRENFMLNRKIENIVYLGFDELEWARKFSAFINDDNVFALYRHLNMCILHISQNGNSKIIFTDLVLHVKELIRPKKIGN